MMGQPAPPESEAMAELHRILAPALGDLEARSRPALRPAPKKLVAQLDELDRVIAELDARLEALRTPAKPRPAAPPPAARPRPAAPLEMPEPPTLPPKRAHVDIDDLSEGDIPPLPVAFDPPPLPPPSRTTPRPRVTTTIPALGADHPSGKLLYDDILWLVSINDWQGAMISIERLLVLVRLEGSIKEFFDVNEVKLLNLYESFFGPFTRVPSRVPLNLDNAMPDAYERAEKLQAVLRLVDGERTLQAILRESPYTPLETCSAINQARRAGLVKI